MHSHEVQDLATWRTYRAALVQRECAGHFWENAQLLQQPQPLPSLQQHWAHEISMLEKGCLLVARQPDMGPLLTQSVLLLLEHGAHRSLMACPLSRAMIAMPHTQLRCEEAPVL